MNWKYSEAFGGIGAWGKAIQRVTERHSDTCTLKQYWEFDKYASNAFATIHGVSEDLNLWDITEPQEKLSPVDIFFYSPPCQTYSIAGKREGSTVDKGNLFYHAMKHLEKSNPKFAIMENVKGLPSGDTKKDFNSMLWHLESLGYYNYWKVLNTKDYGIPQNRERVFIVSIRSDIYDQGKRFEFPKPFKLEKTLADMLENEVDKKYYLSDEMVSKFISKDGISGYINQDTQASKVISGDGVSQTLSAGTHGYAMGYVNQIGNISESDSFGGNPQTGRIYSTNGLSPTLSTMQGGGQEPKILIGASRGRDKNNPSDRTPGNNNLEQKLEINKEGLCNTLTSVQKDNYVVKVNSATKCGYEEASIGDSINLEYPKSETRRGRAGKQVSQTLSTACNMGVVEPKILTPKRTEYGKQIRKDYENGDIKESRHNMTELIPRDDDISNTISTVQKDNMLYNGISIRKLTPLECFRLQGFDDEDYYRAVEGYDKTFTKGSSDSQMYKRAGNSITVNVIEEILENLLYEREQEVQLSLF